MSAERDAFIAVLVAEYSDVLARQGHWRGSAWHAPTPQGAIFEQGARTALQRVAERIGVTTLHDQAADMVARPQGERREAEDGSEDG